MLIVKKFGGSSVATPEKILKIASKVAEEKKRTNNGIIMVVSAMGKTTDGLIDLAKQINDNPSQREMDMLLSTGERVSMTLMSMALDKHGVEAISFTGSQCQIITNKAHGNARITAIKGDRIKSSLVEGKVVIVAGFQGVSSAGEVTTLGRGGSDTTAVALAAALGADKCEIYTDVDGIYTADPRIVAEAKKIKDINYDLMMSMAYSGSKVMHSRAIEIGLNYSLTIEVKSSLTFEEGSFIKKGVKMENKRLVAISDKKDLCYCKFLVNLSEAGSIFKGFEFKGIEIFEYELLGKEVSLVYEKKYKNEIESVLIDNNIDLPVIVSVKSISLIGESISHNLEFVASILKIIENFHVISVNRGDKDITLIFNEEEQTDELVRNLHNKYIS